MAPLTLPAHASLFTGLYPPRHGVRENADALAGDAGTTLAERLSRSGFRTGAFVASTVLDRSRGLGRGFDRYDEVRHRLDGDGYAGAEAPALRAPQRAPHGRRDASEVVANAAAQWMAGRRASPRFFAWLHFYDAHARCDPPGLYGTAYPDPYDGAVAFIDSQIGTLLERLAHRGLLDRTIVVVIGDHGESLGDHGEQSHGLFVYEPVLHVPFVVRAPFSGLRGRRVGSVTRSVDMMPTVLELLGVERPEPMDGESLLPLVNGEQRDRPAYAENLYPHERFGWSRIRALRAGRFKVIDTARPELYDLARDPRGAA